MMHPSRTWRTVTGSPKTLRRKTSRFENENRLIYYKCFEAVKSTTVFKRRQVKQTYYKCSYGVAKEKEGAVKAAERLCTLWVTRLQRHFRSSPSENLTEQSKKGKHFVSYWVRLNANYISATRWTITAIKWALRSFYLKIEAHYHFS